MKMLNTDAKGVNYKIVNRVEQHIIKKRHKYYEEIDKLCFLSKNLYNATLYIIRQEYFKTKNYMNYNTVNKLFTDSDNVDYRALPSKVSKHTQMLADKNYKSFFKLLKKKNEGSYNKPVKMPKYLHKTKGRYIVHYEKGAINKGKPKDKLKLSGTNIYLDTKLPKEQVQFVRLIPHNNGQYYVLEIGYRKTIRLNALERKEKYNIASIDLGVNNLMTVTSNVMSPIIYSGKPLKSINQYYNKRKAELKSKLVKVNKKESHETSKRLNRLGLKRKNKINDYIHKITKKLVNQLVSNQIEIVVIGYNKGWKQDIKIGSRNNQNFVSIPFKRVIEVITYKLEEKGVKVELEKESYTSKCSFLDNETIKRQDNYKGKRITRGLYKSSEGKLINADVNGSYNILKKYIVRNCGKVAWNLSYFRDCVEVSSIPYLTKEVA